MIANQSETVMTGLHSETTESEVTVMLKEMMKEIGMDFESVKLVCPAKPITHAFIYFENDNERNKFISCINKKHGVPLYLISLNWTTKHVSVKGQIVVKTCQDGSLKFSKYQDVEDEVDELMQKWQTKNSSQRL